MSTQADKMSGLPQKSDLGTPGGGKGAYPLPTPSSGGTSPSSRCQKSLLSAGTLKGARCIHPAGHEGPHFFGSVA